MTNNCSCVICTARKLTDWGATPLEERARRLENMAHGTLKSGGTDCTGLIMFVFETASLLREAIERDAK